MAGHGCTRQVALALLVVSAALLFGCGKEETAAKKGERAAEMHPGREFNSKLRFDVWAVVEEDQPFIDVGVTPSELPLWVPSCRRWGVTPPPFPPCNLAAVAKEVIAERIPGLAIGLDSPDEDAAPLKELKGLQSLTLGGAGVRDATLAHLQGLHGLQWLYLSRTQVTDAGLAHLKELRGLQTLNLRFTKLTDLGLAHLKELKGLKTLDLRRTNVTDAGLAHLEELRGLQCLDLSETRVTDAGLAHLKDLKGLRKLYLGGPRVTDAGLAELKKWLPNVKIIR